MAPARICGSSGAACASTTPPPGPAPAACWRPGCARRCWPARWPVWRRPATTSPRPLAATARWRATCPSPTICRRPTAWARPGCPANCRCSAWPRRASSKPICCFLTNCWPTSLPSWARWGGCCRSPTTAPRPALPRPCQMTAARCSSTPCAASRWLGTRPCSTASPLIRGAWPRALSPGWHGATAWSIICWPGWASRARAPGRSRQARPTGRQRWRRRASGWPGRCATNRRFCATTRPRPCAGAWA